MLTPMRAVCQNFGMVRKSHGKKGSPAASPFLQLSRRERQIMDALYRLGRASAAEIHATVPNPPSYTAIRTHLTLLEEKKQVKHETQGARFVYSPVIPREEMGQHAIEGVLRTFFNDSVDLVITALIKRQQTKLSTEQIEKLELMIEQARKEGR
jgi:predicted transcriptional regulator